MNDKIISLLEELVSITSESTVVKELEGLVKKHRSLTTRRKRSSKVSEEASHLEKAIEAGRMSFPRLIAERALARSFSQASVYRLIRRIRASGVDVKGAEVMREIKRMRQGIY